MCVFTLALRTGSFHIHLRTVAGNTYGNQHSIHINTGHLPCIFDGRAAAIDDVHYAGTVHQGIWSTQGNFVLGGHGIDWYFASDWQLQGIFFPEFAFAGQLYVD